MYEHLKDGAGDSQLAGRFLVDFKSKKEQEKEVQEDHDLNESEQNYQDDENEWLVPDISLLFMIWNNKFSLIYVLSSGSCLKCQITGLKVNFLS